MDRGNVRVRLRTPGADRSGRAPGPALPGDLAPASTYLAVDVVDPPTVTRDPSDGALRVAVHRGRGVASVPDPALVEAHRVRDAAFGAGLR